jgi:hypothetical protein
MEPECSLPSRLQPERAIFFGFFQCFTIYVKMKKHPNGSVKTRNLPTFHVGAKSIHRESLFRHRLEHQRDLRSRVP